MKTFGNKKQTRTFLLILLVVIINYSKSYSQDFWEKTIGLDNDTIWSLAINSSGDIFAGTHMNGVFRSSNGGTSWTNLGVRNYDIYSILIDQNDEIYLTTDPWGGTFTSIDNGNTWTNIGLYHFNKGIVIDSEGDIFVGTTAVGLWRTTNRGGYWSQVLFGSNCSQINSLIINSGGNIFAGTAQGGIFRSSDRGENWLQIIQGLTELQILSLAINSNEDLFAGTSGGGIFRSTDNGNNWVQINQGLTGQGSYIYSIAVNSDGVLFAATDDGMFRSVNNGNNWVQINQGLGNEDVYSLVINSDGDIFAGTLGGVYRSINSTTAINTPETKIISTYELLQNYPNPFNPSTLINYTIPQSGFVSLKVYDLLGNEVAELVNEDTPAGNYEVEFNASVLSSGTYFYKLQTGSFVDTKKMILMK